MTTTPDLQRNQVRPLTRLSKQGVAYRRPPEVEAQIADALRWTPEQLETRVAVHDKDAPERLKDEVLVYFLRQARRDGEDSLAEALTLALVARVTGPVRRHMRAFVKTEEDAQDAVQDVIIAMFEQIVKTDSANGDYAEVRCADFVHKIAVQVSKKYRHHAERFVTKIDDANAPEAPAPMSLHPAEKLDMLRGLWRLPEPLRTAFGWYYGYGVKIASKDPATPTISQHFSVSEKTVRNWLQQAAQVLREWRGETDE